MSEITRIQLKEFTVKKTCDCDSPLIITPASLSAALDRLALLEKVLEAAEEFLGATAHNHLDGTLLKVAAPRQYKLRAAIKTARGES